MLVQIRFVTPDLLALKEMSAVVEGEPILRLVELQNAVQVLHVRVVMRMHVRVVMRMHVRVVMRMHVRVVMKAVVQVHAATLVEGEMSAIIAAPEDQHQKDLKTNEHVQMHVRNENLNLQNLHLQFLKISI
jgi:hypothetical protein